MSRRKRRPVRASALARGKPPAGPTPHSEQPAAANRPPDAERAAARGAGGGLAADLAVLAVVFLVAVGVAELAGAANLGVALGVGQVAFAIALAILLIRR
jgi:hypothetical protein